MQHSDGDESAAAEVSAGSGVLELEAERGAASLELPAESFAVRLNLGAGDKIIDGWLSVGLDDHHDIRADLRDLSGIPDESVDELMAIHAIEHIHRWEVPAMLAEWLRVLKPGGRIAIEAPDLLKCCRNILTGDEPRRGLWGLFGDPGYCDPLMTHKWAWTTRELAGLMKEVGFVKLKIRDPLYHGKRVYRDFRVEARA